MNNIPKIALRNVLRYRRRSFMTTALIVIGMLLVIVFSGVLNSFKNMMIGTLTDSMLGHLQIHSKGYVSSIDNLPLHLNMKETQVQNVQKVLDDHEAVVNYSPRIKLGAMLSNFEQTTSIRLMAVLPEMEIQTCPGLADRLKEKQQEGRPFLQPGELILPENLARGLSLKTGDEVVLVTTNQDGSVNGAGLRVAGIVESMMGPAGRDGYLHLEDARELLRLEEQEISEIAIRLRELDDLDKAQKILAGELQPFANKKGQPLFELHTWADLSPFSSIATSVDLLIIVEDFGGGIKRPAVVETTSPLFKGYRSLMIYSGMKLREFPDEVFTLGYTRIFPPQRITTSHSTVSISIWTENTGSKNWGFL